MFYQIIKALQAALTIVWGDNQTVEKHILDEVYNVNNIYIYQLIKLTVKSVNTITL